MGSRVRRPVLVLFDIDGTLAVKAHGRRALYSALSEVLDKPLVKHDTVKFSGSTDPLIVRDIMVSNGYNTDDVAKLLPTFWPVFERHMQKIKDDANTAVECPNATQFVKRLHKEFDHVHLGLVTGNIKATAHIKLSMVPGFEHSHVLFPFGGYGDDSPDRSELVNVAMERAAEATDHHEWDRAVLLGDTPDDIAAARAAGVHAVGVATGSYSADQLADAGADVVLDSLVDENKALAAVLGEDPTTL